ncbi:uncharacterized protein DFL_003017 [Arthrobotrys flagrans]|uniref:Secreted protein n=1 Tax=Arthrobotrys flagrans TaxID=97331 RepID=A0A437AC55_ARTFL|nr:hypothetical protein DFL_003017 [Arthrobotrys flagrans]
MHTISLSVSLALLFRGCQSISQVLTTAIRLSQCPSSPRINLRAERASSRASPTYYPVHYSQPAVARRFSNNQQLPGNFPLTRQSHHLGRTAWKKYHSTTQQSQNHFFSTPPVNFLVSIVAPL